MVGTGKGRAAASWAIELARSGPLWVIALRRWLGAGLGLVDRRLSAPNLDIEMCSIHLNPGDQKREQVNSNT